MSQGLKLKNGSLLITAEAPGGLYNADQLKAIADICDSEAIIVKATEDQRLSLFVTPDKADSVSEALKQTGLGIRGYQEGLHQPVSCLGEQCEEHEQDALSTAMDISSALEEITLDTPLKIGVNGCARCCVPCHTLDISIVGDASGYRVSLGGKNSQIPEMASFLAEGVPANELPKMVAAVVALYKENSENSESLQELIERVGASSFIEALAPYSQDAASSGDPFADLSEASAPEEDASDHTESGSEEEASSDNAIDLDDLPEAVEPTEDTPLDIDELISEESLPEEAELDAAANRNPDADPTESAAEGIEDIAAEEPSIEALADDVNVDETTLGDAPEISVELGSDEEALPEEILLDGSANVGEEAGAVGDVAIADAESPESLIDEEPQAESLDESILVDDVEEIMAEEDSSAVAEKESSAVAEEDSSAVAEEDSSAVAEETAVTDDVEAIMAEDGPVSAAPAESSEEGLSTADAASLFEAALYGDTDATTAADVDPQGLADAKAEVEALLAEDGDDTAEEAVAEQPDAEPATTEAAGEDDVIAIDDSLLETSELDFEISNIEEQAEALMQEIEDKQAADTPAAEKTEAAAELATPEEMLEDELASVSDEVDEQAESDLEEKLDEAITKQKSVAESSEDENSGERLETIGLIEDSAEDGDLDIENASFDQDDIVNQDETELELDSPDTYAAKQMAAMTSADAGVAGFDIQDGNAVMNFSSGASLRIDLDFLTSAGGEKTLTLDNQTITVKLVEGGISLTVDGIEAFVPTKAAA